MPPALQGQSVALRLLYFLIYGSSATWFPFFGMYLERIGLSGLQIGLIISANPAMAIISQPLWGMIADLWGRRRTLTLTLALGTLAILGFALGGGFWFLLGWTTLYALLSSPINSLFDTMVLDYVERTGHLSYGRLRLWGAVAWACAAYAAGVAIESRDIRLMFLFGAALMAAGWLLARRTFRESGHAAAPTGSRWKDSGQLLRNRRLIIFVTLVALLKIGTSSTFTFFAIFLDRLGASDGLIGLAYGIQGLSELPIFLIAAPLIRRFGIKRVLLTAFVLLAIRPLLYSVILEPVPAVLAQLLHGSFSLFLVASVAYVDRIVPRAWRATGQAVFWAANMGIGGILGNMLGGYLYDLVGLHRMYGLSGLFILAVAVAALITLRKDPVQSEPSIV